jgi:hypothetical protein
MRRACLFMLFCFVTLGLATSVATAGTYEVSGCEEDVREPLPKFGWILAGSPPQWGLQDNCEKSPTEVTVYDTTPPGAAGGITLKVPRPLSIVGYQMRVLEHAQAHLDFEPRYWWNAEVRRTPVGGVSQQAGFCSGQYHACDSHYWRTPMTEQPPMEQMDWLLRCAPDSPNPCYGGSGVGITFLSMRFRIDDPVAPVLAQSPAGAVLAGARDVSGVQTVGLEASDVGSGVFRAVLYVDGAPASEKTFDEVTPSCRAPFRAVLPCATKLASTLDLDTSQFVDGPHAATLTVYDATNTNSVSYGPVTFGTANHTFASYCAMEDRRRVRLSVPATAQRFGRAFRVSGAVSNAAGWEAVLLDGHNRVRAVASTNVSRRGRVSIRVPAGPSRALRLAVRPSGARSKYVCGRERRVDVRAAIALHVSPHTVSNGRAITIRGRLRGQSRGRRSIVIQARARQSSRWSTVRVLRTSPDGRYRMRYRFLKTFSTVDYLFRSQVRAEKGYPYATGRSATARVRVIG